MSLDDIKTATAHDKTLMTAMDLVRTGRWHDMKNIDDPAIDMTDLREYNNVREELTWHPDNILLRGKRTVIPPELQDQAVRLAHEGHQGMSRSEGMIRSKVWFPGIDNKVETAVKSCIACQAVYSGPKVMEPLRMSELSPGPWQHLSMDFCGQLPTSKYLIVIVDEYSRYPVIEIVKSVSANTVIPVLDKVLSTFGYPKVIKSDNGSPFNSFTFAEYARHSGFVHRRITPIWPRANSQAESFNKPLIKMIQAAHVEGRNWKQELQKHLCQYRATPHPSTGFSPYKLLFGRDPITKLPQLPADNVGQWMDLYQQARYNDSRTKKNQKQYTDNRLGTKHRDINIGDSVLVRHDRKHNKLSTPFNPKTHVVLKKNGSITASNEDHEITRNSSWFKKVPFTSGFNQDIPKEEDIMLHDHASKHDTSTYISRCIF